MPPEDATPSAGVDNQGQGSPPPSDSNANLTDDQILGLDSSEDFSQDSPPPEAGATGAETGTGEPPQAEGQKQGQPGQEEVPTEGVIEPEEFKAIFKMPGVGPKIRDLFYRHQAYQQLFHTVADARSLREIFPEGAESAKEVLGQVEQLETFDELLTAAPNDPNAAYQFAQAIHTENPEGFRALLNILPQMHAQVDAEGYRADSYQRITGFLDYLHQQASGDPDRERGENLLAAIDVISRRAWNTGYQEPTARNARQQDPREVQISQREQALNQREQQAAQHAQVEFQQSCVGETVHQVKDLIGTQLQELLPKETTEGARNRIATEVYREVDKTLKANQPLVSQVKRLLKNGDRGEQHIASVVQFVVARAKALIPAKTAKVVKEWTGTVLASNNQQVNAQRQQAGRGTDVGTGGAPSGDRSGKTPTPKQLDYGRMSDDDILAGNYSLRR